jgi:hypothetical protein
MENVFSAMCYNKFEVANLKGKDVMPLEYLKAMTRAQIFANVVQLTPVSQKRLALHSSFFFQL